MKLAYDKANALNAICPYFTMFPIEYPLRILKKHKNKKPVVLDPFCGRGTTLFAARTLGFEAWGFDSSPIAVAISKAKLATCTIGDAIYLAEKILNENRYVEKPSCSFFKMAFHSKTLHDLCILRRGLMDLEHETDASAVLRAAILGCLHGPLSKNLENTSYFSNQMPRTYAPKPDYAVKYWKEKNISAPKINVLRVLNRKLQRLTELENTSPSSISQVLQGDSQSSNLFKQAKARPSVVITSPPYYGMKTYIQDQWLRNWFLGGPSSVDYSLGEQLDHKTKESFASSMGKVWRNIHETSKSSEPLHMYIRFGIIPSFKTDAKKIFLGSLEESNRTWRLISNRSAMSANVGKRQAHQMKAKSTPFSEFDFHVVKV